MTDLTRISLSWQTDYDGGRLLRVLLSNGHVTTLIDGGIGNPECIAMHPSGSYVLVVRLGGSLGTSLMSRPVLCLRLSGRFLRRGSLSCRPALWEIEDTR